MAELTLEIVTPERRVATLQADEVRAPGVLGGFGIRRDHTPFMSQLQPGRLTVVDGASEVFYRYLPLSHALCLVREALAAALAQIEKQFGKGSIMKMGESQVQNDLQVVSTGSLGLDIAYAPLVPYSRVPIVIATGAVLPSARSVDVTSEVVSTPMAPTAATTGPTSRSSARG